MQQPETSLSTRRIGRFHGRRPSPLSGGNVLHVLGVAPVYLRREP
jgi:hypothetical protein